MLSGAATFAGAPFINHQSLSEKGFIADEIKKIGCCRCPRHLILPLYLINIPWVKNACNDLGFTPEQYNDFEWSLLEALGFSEEEIEAR